MTISSLDNPDFAYDEKEALLRELVTTMATSDNEELRSNIIFIFFNLLAPLGNSTSDYSELALKHLIQNLVIEIQSTDEKRSLKALIVLESLVDNQENKGRSIRVMQLI